MFLLSHRMKRAGNRVSELPTAFYKWNRVATCGLDGDTFLRVRARLFEKMEEAKDANSGRDVAVTFLYYFRKFQKL